ncbi:MAG: putative signal transducing protein [Armatimonadota bacterium]
MHNREDYIVVYNAMDEIQALLYRNLLEEAGIDVLERPMEIPWLEGLRLDDIHSQLLVHEEDVERASQLIEAFHQEAEEGTLTLPSDKDPLDETDDTAKG